MLCGIQSHHSAVARRVREILSDTGRTLAAMLLVVMLASCAGPRTVDQSVGHVGDSAEPVAEMPKPVAPPPAAPRPDPAPPVPTYTVVARDIPVKDLLFSLARDTGLDLDIQAGSDKLITINAVDQPLPQILQRISDQAGLRFSMRGRNLIVLEDLPYWHNYSV
ncbi:MAG: hypothetical protein RLN69_14890, partial [Woeseiaceae bacterium]